MLGDSSAPVKIVEFSDLECPYCKRFNEERIPSIRQEFGPQVTIVFVHFLLPMHRFARPAARAAECAGAQDRFGEFVETVFRKQDSLGLKSWGDYAKEAGVRDSTKFWACVREQTPVAAIEAGKAAGTRLGVRGTPALMVNGWLYDAPPDDTILSRDIRRLLDGRSPTGIKGL
jgi:protein-disulfide isomerase